MKPLQIGITGGIGSGKTVVCRALDAMGYPVFDADDVAKGILENEQVKEKVITLLGEDSYRDDGKANREFIASLVFSNEAKLSQLNSLIHPAVQQQYILWVQSHNHSPIVFKEAAIMFESGSYKDMDRIIAIVAPLELRIKRTMERDGKNREQVMHIVSKQLPEEELALRSDFVITNDDKTPVFPQLLAILHQITNPK